MEGPYFCSQKLLILLQSNMTASNSSRLKQPLGGNILLHKWKHRSIYLVEDLKFKDNVSEHNQILCLTDFQEVCLGIYEH